MSRSRLFPPSTAHTTLYNVTFRFIPVLLTLCNGPSLWIGLTPLFTTDLSSRCCSHYSSQRAFSPLYCSLYSFLTIAFLLDGTHSFLAITFALDEWCGVNWAARPNSHHTTHPMRSAAGAEACETCETRQKKIRAAS